MTYRMKNEALNAQIADLVEAATLDEESPNADLATEIIVTALKALRVDPGRADMKMMNTALKELRYSSLVFKPFTDVKKVAVYGSARTPPDDPNYLLAEEFGRRMAEHHDWMVITGAGPGIMEAANRGAGTDASFGVNIRLPFENGANEYLSPGKVINFKYFFTRKVQFVKESNAFALLPGGWGTMDESFELLTLVQTGKSDMHPIVMLEAEGSGYWQPWLDLTENLADKGMIAPADKSLYTVTTDIDVAIDEIIGFYRVYHSQRIVDGKLVIRLNHEVSDTDITALSRDFADIIVSGSIERSEPAPAEVATDDNLDLPRLAFSFDRRSYGRLRLLIDRLNEFEPA